MNFITKKLSNGNEIGLGNNEHKLHHRQRWQQPGASLRILMPAMRKKHLLEFPIVLDKYIDEANKFMAEHEPCEEKKDEFIRMD